MNQKAQEVVGSVLQAGRDVHVHIYNIGNNTSAPVTTVGALIDQLQTMDERKRFSAIKFIKTHFGDVQLTSVDASMMKRISAYFAKVAQS